MPFCPNCRTEYIGGATRCRDCGAELVDTLAQAPLTGAEREAQRPGELCEVSDLVELDLLEAQLRAAGIASVRRPRSVALFVPARQVGDARKVLAGETLARDRHPLGLSELHRIRLVCESCEKVTSVDLLTERVPDNCPCGHYFELSGVRPVLDRYADVMRMLADADFEIELEPPEA